MQQMPIVDGLTSTKMIRSFEKSHPDLYLSDGVAHHGRVPIFAVSASLIEKHRKIYIDAGFDGWILKPIDFKRLSVLLSGIVEEIAREDCLYRPGEWERGGWFVSRQPNIFSASTTQPRKGSKSGSPSASSSSPPSLDGAISTEQGRLDQFGADAAHAESFPPESSASTGARE